MLGWEAVPAALPGGSPAATGSEVVDWITAGTRSGRTIASAIPPVFASYATLVIPDGDTAKTRADAALVDVLRAHSTAQPWWLGYLDTGVADLVVADAVKVAAYAGWEYVLLEADAAQALDARRNADVTPWHSALPELVFPGDRSWLVSTLWDNAWRCIGGPVDLVDALLLRPELEVRAVTPEENMTPPGHELD